MRTVETCQVAQVQAALMFLESGFKVTHSQTAVLAGRAVIIFFTSGMARSSNTHLLANAIQTIQYNHKSATSG